jgi:hypothetical protein
VSNRKKRYLKIGDYTLFVLLLGFIVFFFGRYIFAGSQGKTVKITGKDYQASYDLNNERVLDVGGPLGATRVIIRDGNVWVEDSPCREKICIKMGKIKRVGEQVVCLPNRVFIELEGGNRNIDGVSR